MDSQTKNGQNDHNNRTHERAPTMKFSSEKVHDFLNKYTVYEHVKRIIPIQFVQ